MRIYERIRIRTDCQGSGEKRKSTLISNWHWTARKHNTNFFNGWTCLVLVKSLGFSLSSSKFRDYSESEFQMIVQSLSIWKFWIGTDWPSVTIGNRLYWIQFSFVVYFFFIFLSSPQGFSRQSIGENVITVWIFQFFNFNIMLRLGINKHCLLLISY